MVSTPRTREIFSEENMVQSWLDVEAALAAAQALLGLIPEGAAETIAQHAYVEQLDHPRFLHESEQTNHPIVALVRQLVELCGPAGKYVHWGATTQDILDTGAMLQLRQAMDVHRAALLDVIVTCTKLAAAHRDTVMAGRTHGQHALPITFGFKVAIWLQELMRHLTRFDAVRERVLVGQLAGGVGTLAGYGARGREVQQEVCSALGLAVPSISWHTARDGIAEFVCVAAMIGGTIAKIANEIAVLQRTEVAELEEPFGGSAVGSSTMPHKRNPIISEGIVASCALLRDIVPTAIDAMGHEHERDSRAWNLEWFRLPEVACILASVLERIHFVLDGLRVDGARMTANLQALAGMILSEAVMLRLGQTMGREQAHHLVYGIAMEAHRTGRPFRSMIEEHEQIRESTSPAELDEIFALDGYLGHARSFVDDAVTRANTLLTEQGCLPDAVGAGGIQSP